MLTKILNYLFQSDKRNTGLEQKQMAAYKKELANDSTDAGNPLKPANEQILSTNPDYQALSGRFGSLESLRGKTLSLELHEAAKLMNRRRVKADAFYSLKKNLMNDFGINLNIYNNKRSKNEVRDF